MKKISITQGVNADGHNFVKPAIGLGLSILASGMHVANSRSGDKQSSNIKAMLRVLNAIGKSNSLLEEECRHVIHSGLIFVNTRHAKFGNITNVVLGGAQIGLGITSVLNDATNNPKLQSTLETFCIVTGAVHVTAMLCDNILQRIKYRKLYKHGMQYINTCTLNTCTLNKFLDFLDATADSQQCDCEDPE